MAQQEQIDRDAAADWLRAEANKGHGSVVEFDAAMRLGLKDDHSLVQAFARHRLAERERALRIIQRRVELWRDKQQDGTCATSLMEECEDIAHAIRASSPAQTVKSDSAIEAMGEALFALSARLKAAGFLDDTTNHAAYELVVGAWQKVAP